MIKLFRHIRLEIRKTTRAWKRRKAGLRGSLLQIQGYSFFLILLIFLSLFCFRGPHRQEHFEHFIDKNISVIPGSGSHPAIGIMIMVFILFVALGFLSIMIVSLIEVIKKGK